MNKHKDPAFLFYPESFLVGVMDMTDEEVGQYIRLLCRQHQKGHLPTSVIKKSEEAVQEKFIQDESGNWYNERLELEIEKRKKWTESRRRNLQSKKDEKDEPRPKAYREFEKEEEIEAVPMPAEIREKIGKIGGQNE